MERVTVLEPSALLTVTVERGERDEVHLHAGGQGCWISRMLAVLGVHVRLVVPLGGESGQVLAPLLQQLGLEVCAVPVQAWNGCYVDDRQDGSRERLAQTPALSVTRHDVDDVCSAIRANGVGADVVVLAGASDGDVLPPAAYRALAADVTASGTKVVVDLSGKTLDAALAGGVFLAKVSDEQLRDTGRVTHDDEAALVEAARELRRQGAAHVVVTRAHKPVLALLDDRVVVGRVPRVEEVDHTGAGDSLTAGVVAGVARGAALPDALRLGMAAGALNAARHGLGSGRRPDVERFSETVEILELGSTPAETAVSRSEIASWVQAR
jgi:1-phosphofructokinase